MVTWRFESLSTTHSLPITPRASTSGMERVRPHSTLKCTSYYKSGTSHGRPQVTQSEGTLGGRVQGVCVCVCANLGFPTRGLPRIESVSSKVAK